MIKAVISGTGLYTPPEKISNEELVVAFNAYVENFNQENAQAIEAGDIEALKPSSAAFIEQASGIKSRYVMTREGVLDPKVMHPILPRRTPEEMSYQCEVAVVAAKQAMQQAGKTVDDIDGVLVGASGIERSYPAVATEVQNALGIQGYAYDFNIACASATFGIQQAAGAIATGQARAVLVINPELCSGQLNYKDRDSHFIFGDAAVACVVEAKSSCQSKNAFEVIALKLKTQFSNNIRNNSGFMDRTYEAIWTEAESLFRQKGKRVFKDVVPMVAQLIKNILEEQHIHPDQLKRLWLHQANLSMNQLICKKVLGHEASQEDAPVILDEYANTSSAGSMIAFHKYSSDLSPGDLGVICAFGAGYSSGAAIIRKL